MHSQQEIDNAILGFFIPLVSFIGFWILLNPFKDRKKHRSGENDFGFFSRYRSYIGLGMLFLLTIAGFMVFVKFFYNF